MKQKAFRSRTEYESMLAQIVIGTVKPDDVLRMRWGACKWLTPDGMALLFDVMVAYDIRLGDKRNLAQQTVEELLSNGRLDYAQQLSLYAKGLAPAWALTMYGNRGWVDQAIRWAGMPRDAKPALPTDFTDFVTGMVRRTDLASAEVDVLWMSSCNASEVVRSRVVESQYMRPEWVGERLGVKVDLATNHPVGFNRTWAIEVCRAQVKVDVIRAAMPIMAKWADTMEWMQNALSALLALDANESLESEIRNQLVDEALKAMGGSQYAHLVRHSFERRYGLRRSKVLQQMVNYEKTLRHQVMWDPLSGEMKEAV